MAEGCPAYNNNLHFIKAFPCSSSFLFGVVVYTKAVIYNKKKKSKRGYGIAVHSGYHSNRKIIFVLGSYEYLKRLEGKIRESFSQNILK